MEEMKRSKMQIFVDILRVIQKKERAKPTHILYGANLSHVRLKEYLGFLLENKFIEKISESKRVLYKLTSKGYRYLQEFKRVEELSEAFGLSI